MSNAIIRVATEADAEAILAIYRPYVTEASVSFELESPTLDEMRQRITNTLQKWPWLVCEKDGQVAGYVYASKHRDRAAYQWGVDVTAYVNPHFQRGGLGRGLYASLFALLRWQGFYNAYAGITLPNPASVGLHEAVGFKPVGVYERVGFKLGDWHDVGWWQLRLQPLKDNPPPPIAFSELPDDEQRQTALAAGLPLLKL